MKVLRRLALDEHGVRLDFENRTHRKNIRAAQVDERPHETAVRRHPFVPPAVLRRKERGYEDLVDRREVADPAEPVRECPRVVGEQFGPVGVLKATDPVRHAEVAEIRDRHDCLIEQRAERLVREAPVVFVRTEMDLVVGRPVTQVVDPEFLDEPEVVAPVAIVAGTLHLINAERLAADGDGRVAVLDSCGEHELTHVASMRCKPCARLAGGYRGDARVSFCTRMLASSPTRSVFSALQSIELTVPNSFGRFPAAPNFPMTVPSSLTL